VFGLQKIIVLFQFLRRDEVFVGSVIVYEWRYGKRVIQINLKRISVIGEKRDRKMFVHMIRNIIIMYLKMIRSFWKEEKHIIEKLYLG